MSAGQKASDAVRIGKAISKGAAAGGLWGAALGAAIRSERSTMARLRLWNAPL